MENSTAINLTSCDWRISEDVVGPAVAAFTAVIFLLSLITNLFICIHTLIHGRTILRNGATLLLFNLSISNLIVTIIYLPFITVSFAAQEWIIGITDGARNVTCHIAGLVLTITVASSLHIIAAISFDRWLFITKPYLHKKIMTWKTALGIVLFIWAYTLLFNLLFVIIDTSINGGDLCRILPSNPSAICIPITIVPQGFVIVFSILVLIPFLIIIITSVWTFVFTRRYLGKDLRRRTETLPREDLKIQKSVYNIRVRKLFGIFTALFFFNFISVTPFFISIIVLLATGNVPPRALTAVLILYLVSNVSNPLIQSYFRKDLKDSIVKYTKKMLFCYDFKEESDTARSSHHASNSNSFSQSRRSRNAPGGAAIRGSCDDAIGRDRGSRDDAMTPGKDRVSNGVSNGDVISPPGSIPPTSPDCHSNDMSLDPLNKSTATLTSVVITVVEEKSNETNKRENHDELELVLASPGSEITDEVKESDMKVETEE